MIPQSSYTSLSGAPEVPLSDDEPQAFINQSKFLAKQHHLTTQKQHEANQVLCNKLPQHYLGSPYFVFQGNGSNRPEQ